ncbi:hypothetical protein [Rickettsia endosymbiont of Cardiosporidium cionae]|uniref:hypothetical protein n=1 Tax=Rickettsia endosymbiont of Cardiosporidium cionae TaxID=2777155 RepID=UPI001893AD7D|nr:hypothetical protein [Rickettsia endosymbiont of Cardiosporidium cionae]KAF8818698.1 hypothetical protein IHI24_000423 [Rickettsia endosymbiont of Cardiosporidium cionae]
MFKITTSLFFFLIILCINAYAAFNVRVEIKASGNDIFFIIHHENQDKNLDINVSQNLVIADAGEVINYGVLDSSLSASSDIYSITTTSDMNGIKFNFDTTKLKYNTTINGERLTAVKFTILKEKLKQFSNIENIDKGNITKNIGNNSSPFTLDITNNSDAKVAAFVRDKYLWIVLNKEDNFNIPTNNVIKNSVRVSSESGAVFRLEINKDYKYIELIKKKSQHGSGLSIVLSLSERVSNANIMSATQLDDMNSLLVQSKNHEYNYDIVKFEDPDVGDTLNIITFAEDQYRFDKVLNLLDFRVLPSVSGVVIDGNDVSVIFDEQYQGFIIKPAPSSYGESYILPPGFDNTKITNLAFLDSNLDVSNFNNQKSSLLASAAFAKNSEERLYRHLLLAIFFFKHSLYHESLSTLLLLKSDLDKNNKYYFYIRFLTAVNYSIVGIYDKAKLEYSFLLDSTYTNNIPEIKLWSEYNNILLYQHSPKIVDFASFYSIINIYPDDLYWVMISNIARYYFNNNQLKSLENVIKSVREPNTDYYTDFVLYWSAQLIKKKLSKYEELLKNIIIRDKSQFFVIKAKLDLLKQQVISEVINYKDAIQLLNSIKLSWRGGDLEYDILTTLAGYYENQGDFINSLRTYQYVMKMFFNTKNLSEIDHKSKELFKKIFLFDRFTQEIDNIKFIALFYEFKDLSPIGSVGDRIVMNVIDKLIELDLLSEASNLLMHQIKYRLKGNEKIVKANQLAMLLTKLGKYEESISVLNITDLENIRFSEHQKRILLKANNFLYLKKYSDMFNMLHNIYGDEANNLRKIALFQSNKLSQYIALAEKDFDKMISNTNLFQNQQDILSLAIAYYKTNSQDKLYMLQKSLLNKNPMLENLVNFMVNNNILLKDTNILEDNFKISSVSGLLQKYQEQNLAKNFNE